MISDLEITTNNRTDLSWKNLKNEFINMEFSSIISKDKSWQKYIKTFENLERNMINVS